MTIGSMKCSCLAVLLASGAAAADERAGERPGYAVTPQLHVQSNFGIASWARALSTKRGSAWGVIVGYSPFRYAGVEVQYVGATNDVVGSLFDHITTGGGLLDLRVRYPFIVEPFLFGGLGFMHFDLTGAQGRRSINSAAWPIGAGIEGRVRGNVLLGVRFSYDFVGKAITGLGNGDLWTLTVNLGTSIQ